MSSVTFLSTISKEQALVALWNSTKALGMGFLHSHQKATLEAAKAQLEGNQYVDYFLGKPIKTDFSKYPVLESYLYDRDAGPGTMQKVADGMGPSIGATKKLTETEAQKLKKDCFSSIQIVPGTLGEGITTRTLGEEGSAKQMKVSQFDKVYLTPEWVEKAKCAGIPYPEEWFMVASIETDQNDNPTKYKLIGSMGGGWMIDWDCPGVIKKNLGFASMF